MREEHLDDDDILPQSVSQSTVNILGVNLAVHQLNNGERVIEESSMMALFARMADPDLPVMTEDDAKNLAVAIKGVKKAQNFRA